MSSEPKETSASAQVREEQDAILNQPGSSKLIRFYANPWTQIGLISLICFCLPGIYNALSGLGGAGQVDPTVAANASVALLSTTAATALFIVGPIFSWTGPRICFLIGGWSYALYTGSLLHFNHYEKGSFVIASGAILGIGSSFVWIVQGAIITTYVDESQKGRAIAIFWIIFNLGGGIGSLVSFGLNYHSTSGTVSDSTYIALLVIMAFGYVLGIFICSPSRIRLAQLQNAVETDKHSVKGTFMMAVKTITKWRVALMVPFFYSANVFYSYQQNNVNGETFNIRTRSLNGALYWMTQMLGGLIIGLILDMPWFGRGMRARIGWAVLLITGFVIWGGGYVFQLWQNKRAASGLVQDVDYLQGSISAGPIMLYIFYGGYAALWQGFAYWLIGTESNSSARAAILVGAYKTLQAAGGAMAWRINALHTSPLTQFGMDWGLCIGSLVIILPTVWTVSDRTTVEAEILDEGAKQEQTPKKVEAGVGDHDIPATLV
ncbi:putative MFS transporter [Xylaria nigripes]|nr:putative MFS transporter [Xylaria nigripes]